MLGSRFPFPSAVALLGSLWPSLSPADVPSSACPSGVTAGSCYAGDYSNDTIVKISEPDSGATGASFDVYSSADLSNDASGPAKPIELDTEGGWGDDDSGAAGSAGNITLVNDGALSWSATGTANEVLVVYALSRGGDGQEPSEHGGVGGNGNSVQITNNGGFTAAGGVSGAGV
ncbi:hypothetical protein CKO31_01890 [Thiohalocapsa halophila]|uniref:Autotransporter outer membrane beta-barrel domain-containing protein n=1 Tax=Thiohalocapsa halophila TaxID=69359 RepID=A0ABS1CC84_9GAMM|nr:hypothetical protein [Thiohalocapsa halophila]MBK1629507.1 hypothetical protein [Thiohalocapsa halophila]